MLGTSHSVFRRNLPGESSNIRISITGLTDNIAQTGEVLTGSGSETLDSQNWQVNTGGGFVDIAGATQLTYTPRIGTDGVTDQSQLRLRGVVALTDYFSPYYEVRHVPPVASTLNPVSEEQGNGVIEVNLSAGFAGEDLTYVSDQTWAPVSGSTLTVADEVRLDVVTVTAINSGGSASAPLNVEITAPEVSVSNPLPDQIITQGTGDVTADLRSVFNNAESFDVAGPSASLDTDGYTLRLDDTVLRAGVTVTVTGANSFGSAQDTFLLTVLEASSVAITAATFGTQTAPGNGGTRVKAPNGTYNGGNLSVTNNILTKANGGTLTEGEVIVGETTVSIVSGKNVANGAEFAEWLDETGGGSTLSYNNLIVSGDVVTEGIVTSWNNKLRNLPVGFTIQGAYGFNRDLAPNMDAFVIQTSGVINGSETLVDGLRFRHIDFFRQQSQTELGYFTVPITYFIRNLTRTNGLDIQECWFASDQLSAIEGGTYVNQVNGVALRGNAVDTIIENNLFERLTYPVTHAGDGLLMRYNTISRIWADYVLLQGGARRAFIYWNHFDTQAGDGTYLHGDMAQIQAANGSGNVSQIVMIGNTMTPGEYQSIAYSQAEARNDDLTFSTNRAQFPIDQNVILSSPADQGYRTQVRNTTANRTITLPDAASNGGFTTVIGVTGSNQLILGLQSGDTIEGGVTQLDPSGFDELAIYSDGTSEWKILPPGLRQNNVLRSSGHTLDELDDNMLTLVDATDGNATITLPAEATTARRFLVKKSDASTNTVTIQTSGGQRINKAETGVTGETSQVISHPGAAILFTRSAGGMDWAAEDATITLQGFFANPHANFPTRNYDNIWLIGNVMMPLSSNGLAIESPVEDGYYVHNTLARFIPEEINGDGFVGRAEGWLNGPSGTIVLRDQMASVGNFTMGNLNQPAGVTNSRQIGNYAARSGSGDLVTAAQVLAEQISLLTGTTEADFRPITRAETLNALDTTGGAAAGTGAHAVTNFVSEEITLPRLAPYQVFPQRSASAVPLDSPLLLRFNYPVDKSLATIQLFNVTDSVVVAAAVTIDRTDVIITPATNLVDGKTYRITLDASDAKHLFATFIDPTFGALPIAAAPAAEAIGATDWTFTASASAYANGITTLDAAGDQANPNFFTSTGVLLNAAFRIDNNLDATYSTGDLPSDVIFRTRVSGTTGTARVRLFSVGGNGGQIVTVNLSDGSITSNDGSKLENTDFGTTAVTGGFEVWIRDSNASEISRYYIELAYAGSTAGLNWSEVVLIPANDPTAPFVAPLAPWHDTAPLNPPVITGVPTISGLPQVGETLTATVASVVGNPTPERTWQWVNTSSGDIPGATGGTYILQNSDEGDTVTVRQTETNSEGSDSATSAATLEIDGAPSGPSYADSLIPDLDDADWGSQSLDGNGWLINPSNSPRLDSNFATYNPQSGIHTMCFDLRATNGGGNTNCRFEFRNFGTGGYLANVTVDLRSSAITIDSPAVVEPSELIDLGGGEYRVRMVFNLDGGGRQWFIVNDQGLARGYDWKRPAVFAGNVATTDIANLS